MVDAASFTAVSVGVILLLVYVLPFTPLLA